jgi:hypothetical protein
MGVRGWDLRARTNERLASEHSRRQITSHRKRWWAHQSRRRQHRLDVAHRQTQWLADTGRRTHLTFEKSLSRMYREVGVSLTPRGLRQPARSISRLSPILRIPAVLFAIKIASLILRPDSRLVDVTSFQSVRRRSLSFGSSSLISRRRHCLSVSFLRLRPPGNIQSLSRRRLTRRTRPRFEATNFDDLAILQNTLSEIQ